MAGRVLLKIGRSLLAEPIRDTQAAIALRYAALLLYLNFLIVGKRSIVPRIARQLDPIHISPGIQQTT